MNGFFRLPISFKMFAIYSTKIIFTAFTLYIFILLKLGTINIVPNVEWGFYQSYTESIIKDYDFNILNNIPPSAAWIVSSTFNYPEMHDNGAPILWAPIVKFFEVFNIQEVLISPDLKFSQSSAIYFIINLFLFLFSFILLKQLTETLIQNKLFFINIFFLIFGTGLFYYFFVEYTGTEITLFFYSTLLLTYYSQITKSDSPFFYFLFGILFGYGRIIKIHFLTYLVPFFYFYWINNRFENFKFHFKRFIYFLVGFGILLVLLEYNNYLKFGFINEGQGYLIEFSTDSFFKINDIVTTYWGPLGFFYLTPLFFFTFILFFYGLYKLLCQKKISNLEKIGIILYTSIIFKLLALLFVPTPGLCEFGERNFIIDSTAHFFLISSFFINIKNRFNRIIFIFIFLLFCTWTLINFFWQREVMTWVPNQQMAHYIWNYKIIYQEIVIHFYRAKYTFYFLFDNFFKNINLFYLCLFCSIILVHSKFLISNISNKKNIRITSLALFFLYTTVTILNNYNNLINSEQMRTDSKYSNILIGNGPHIFTYDNVATDLIPMMELDKYLNNKAEFEFKKKWFKNFLLAATNEILVDRIGFVEAQKNDRIPRIGVSDQEDEHDVLNYEIPARFKIKTK